MGLFEVPFRSDAHHTPFVLRYRSMNGTINFTLFTLRYLRANRRSFGCSCPVLEATNR
jgi:hypothetical protein